QATLYEGREPQQSQRVGDLGAGASDPLTELVLGAAEVLQQLLVGVRLLQGIELGAVEVLQQRIAQEIVIAGFTDDRGDRLEAGTARRAPATLTHDELEGLAVIGDRDRADHDGLE